MDDLVTAIKFVLETGWNFLDSVDVPGLGISFGFFFIGIFIAILGIRIVAWALGLSGEVASSSVIPERVHRFANARPGKK